MADLTKQQPESLAPAPERSVPVVAEEAKTEEAAERFETERGAENAIAAKKEMPAGPAPKIVVPKKKPAPILPMRDETTVKIEKIMEDGLGEAFGKLSPVAKEEFKLKGEKTAGQIRILLDSAHVKVKKILRLIYEWLKMLPGINRFFLEQEAKIKVDKIIALKNKL